MRSSREQRGRASVQPRAAGAGHVLVDGAADERVDEAQRLRGDDRLDDLGAREPVGERRGRGGVEPGQGRGEREVRRLPSTAVACTSAAADAPTRATRSRISDATRPDAMCSTAAAAMSSGAPRSWCSSSASRNGLPRVAV